ncbi:hypothetical protein A4H97_22210, partial [Niastella yeongjuensis]
MPEYYPFTKSKMFAALKCLLVFVILLSTNQLKSQTPVITRFNPEAIPQGYPTIIEGQYFTGATAVYFDDTIPATFTVVSDTQIKTAVPRNARGGFVRVTTPAGTGRSARAFSIASGVPYIDYFTPKSGITGTVVTMKGFNFSKIKEVGQLSVAGFTVVSDSILKFVVGDNLAWDSKWEIIVSYDVGSPTIPMLSFRNTNDTFAYKYATNPIPSVWSFTPATGTLGTPVTINGYYLTGATAVSIGGIPAASFTVISPTSIQAVLAAGTNSGAISVTTPGGTTSLDGFIYTAPNLSAPHISSFTPTSAIPGTMVTIKGNNLTGATAVSFGGTPATSFTITSDSTITAQVGLGSSGSVKVTNPGGRDSLGSFTYIALLPVITGFNPD